MVPVLTLAMSSPAWAAEAAAAGGGSLQLVGSGLIGMAVGCGGVAGFVLVSESKTTNKTKRYIECVVAAVSLVAGAAILMMK
jgi:hypothetical protein